MRLFLVAVAVLLAFAPVARADGDPASDVLLTQDVFYGAALDLESKPAAQLPALLVQSAKKGYEIRVAAISRVDDLGIATFMWKDPESYATFLGNELGLVYKARTLIVMPNGYGIFHLGHSTVREQRLLDRLPAPQQPAGFLPGATDAVERLAAAQGVKLTVPDVNPPPGGVKPIAPIHATPQAVVTTAPGATVTPRPGRPPVTGSGGSSGAWMFVIPVAAFVLVALGAIARSRLRERRLSRS